MVIFTANAGSANLQPRLEGAEKAIKDSGAPIKLHTIVTGSLESGEKSAIEAYWTGHPTTKGMYAVDGGDTAELAGVMQKLGLAAKGVKAGGFDLTEDTQKLLHEGYIEFTIDQQPYLQGFLPILQLFLWQVSGSLTGPAEVDTGLKFIDKETVTPYVNSKSRFEGTSSEVEGGPDPGGHRRLDRTTGARGMASVAAHARPASSGTRSPPAGDPRARAGGPAAPTTGSCSNACSPCARAASSSSRSLTAVYFSLRPAAS